MGLIFIILIVAVGYAFFYNRPGDSPLGKTRTPLDIAEERYARGEISREEFERLKRDLSQ